MNPQTIAPEHHQNILELYRQGWTQTAIAKALGFTRRTVYNHIHRLVFAPGKSRGRPRGSKKLADFKAQIFSRLELQPDISVNQLLRDLQGQGYTGGLSILRDFCRSLRKSNAAQSESASQPDSAYPEYRDTKHPDSEFDKHPHAFLQEKWQLVTNSHFPKMDN